MMKYPMSPCRAIRSQAGSQHHDNRSDYEKSCPINLKPSTQNVMQGDSLAGRLTTAFSWNHQQAVCIDRFEEAWSLDLGDWHELGSVLPDSEAILLLCLEHIQQSHELAIL